MGTFEEKVARVLQQGVAIIDMPFELSGLDRGRSALPRLLEAQRYDFFERLTQTPIYRLPICGSSNATAKADFGGREATTIADSGRPVRRLRGAWLARAKRLSGQCA